MVTLDDRYFPNESATNAKRLVHQSSAPIVFCPHSGGILAIQGFNATQPPTSSSARYSSEPQILESSNPLTLMIPPRYDDLLRRVRADDDRQQGQAPGPHSRLACLCEGVDERLLGGVADARAGRVLTNNEIDYNTTADFSSVVSTALSEKPDVLFVGGPSQATALVIKAAREQGFKGGFVVMDQAKFEEMNKIVPMEMLEDSVGVMPTVHHPDFRAARFVEKYHQKRAPIAIRRAKSASPTAMRVLAGRWSWPAP